MSRPLNVHQGDIVGVWKVLTEPDVSEKIKSNSKYAWCECQICHKEIKYLRCSELKTRGNKCTRTKDYNITKPQKIKIMSFAEWCKQNNDNNLINRWDYNLNEFSPNDISYKSHKDVFIKCPKGKHNSRAISLYSYVGGNSPCNCLKCKLEENSFGKWCETTKPHMLDLWDYDLNNCSPYDIMSKTHKKYYFKCPRGLHKSSLKSIAKISDPSNEIYCAECHSIGQYIIDKYGKAYLDKLWDYNKNKKSPFEVLAGSHTKVFINCLENKKHGSYLIMCSNFTKGRRCPKCKQDNFASVLQKAIVKYIKDNYNYKILHEFDCTIHCYSPITGFELPYDNQVIINSDTFLFIECMGEQHYKINGLVKDAAKKHKITPEEELKRQQWRDEYKKNFVLNSGYNYLAIPYTAEHNNQYQSLIDSAISSIISTI